MAADAPEAGCVAVPLPGVCRTSFGVVGEEAVAGVGGTPCTAPTFARESAEAALAGLLAV